MADGDFVSMVENVDHEIEPGVRVKMETHEPGGDNHSEHNGASSSEPAKEHNPSTGPRLSDLRIGVEEKSHMLTSAWTELSNILGQYKAELYSRDDSTQKYEHTNDVCLLKSELVDKDSEIAHLRMQLGEVQNQCEQIQRHNEQCQMDLSVKDSLLKKYQDDLLQKEAALMTSQTKISRLENRLRMLESRAGAQVERKVVKPVGSPRMSPLARLSRGGLVTRPMLGRMMPGLSPARKRPSLPITPIRSPSASRSTPAKQETQPVVCIEVDDDEIRQEVDLVSQQSLQQEASIGLYGGELYDSATTEATDVGSLPGTSEPQPGTSSASPRQDMLNRPMMVQEEYVGDQDTSLKPQDWPEAYERQQVPAQMQQPQTTNKVFLDKPSLIWHCPHCFKQFGKKYHRDRHFAEVHESVVRFVCPDCGRGFVRREHFRRHLLVHVPRHLRTAEELLLDRSYTSTFATANATVFPDSVNTSEFPSFIEAEQGVIEAEQGVIGAERGVIGAEQGVIGAEQGVIGAEQGVIGAEQGEVGSEQGVVGAEVQGVVGAEQGVIGAEQGVIKAEPGIIDCDVTMQVDIE